MPTSSVGIRPMQKNEATTNQCVIWITILLLFHNRMDVTGQVKKLPRNCCLAVAGVTPSCAQPPAFQHDFLLDSFPVNSGHFAFNLPLPRHTAS